MIFDKIRSRGAMVLMLALLGLWLMPMDAWARAGGGRSSVGSRGSRSAAPPKPYVAPSTPKPTTPTSPGAPMPGATAAPRPAAPPMPSSSGGSSFWRSFGGGMLGGLAGGLLFRSLFGGPSAQSAPGAPAAPSGYGGPGLFDILLLGGIGYLIYRYIKNRREAAAASSGYYSSSMGSVELPNQPQYPPAYDQPQYAPAPEAPDLDLIKGLNNIRQFDPDFDEARFQDLCMDAFFKVQGAYANRDMTPARHLLTSEMFQLLQEDADKLKAAKRINRLENIAVREVNLTEAWQEAGADFITVRMYANLLDYTVDEASGQVLEGSKTDPVKFEEYWTFTRPVGNHPWQLSAIQQPA